MGRTVTRRRCWTPGAALRGVDGLWVIDGSIMPSIPSRGPDSTTIALAHRAAEFVQALSDEGRRPPGPAVRSPRDGQLSPVASGCPQRDEDGARRHHDAQRQDHVVHGRHERGRAASASCGRRAR